MSYINYIPVRMKKFTETGKPVYTFQHIHKDVAQTMGIVKDQTITVEQWLDAIAKELGILEPEIKKLKLDNGQKDQE